MSTAPVLLWPRPGEMGVTSEPIAAWFFVAHDTRQRVALIG
jgi:hypothetical protein